MSSGWRRALMMRAFGKASASRPMLGKIVRVLVNEAWRPAAVLARAFEVCAPERGPALGVVVADGFGIGDAVGPVPSDLPDELADLGQLVRGVDPRVAGEDLLDQRRARPRQADHEDRRRIGVADAGVPRDRKSAVNTVRMRSLITSVWTGS